MPKALHEERKTVKAGFRIRPSVYEKLKDIARFNDTSLANMAEIIILEEYDRIYNKDYTKRKDTRIWKVKIGIYT